MHWLLKLSPLQLQFFVNNFIVLLHFFHNYLQHFYSHNEKSHNRFLVFMSFIYLHCIVSTADKQQALSTCYCCYCSDIAYAHVHTVFCCQMIIVTCLCRDLHFFLYYPQNDKKMLLLSFHHI